MKRILYVLPATLSLLAIRTCDRASGPEIPPPPANNTPAAMHAALPIKPTLTDNLSPPATSAAAAAMPELSDDNPLERLQAVRQAQDKWGAHKHSQASDRQAIVGRWNHTLSDAVYLLLRADGTYRDVALLGDIEGTYRLLPDGTIEFTYSELFGTNVTTREYRLLGDTLEFKGLAAWVPRKRTAQ